ncbi:MAG TPA: response regulator transcription factor [Candidatus Micrarchaeia archaeon]|nr:response regulator transcription factor [Candidatus Micrarchaeia archaeon]
MITIVVADDHPVVRQGLVTMLQIEPDFQVVGEAGDGDAAVREAERHRADVVLMDVQMPGTDGITAVRTLQTASPHTKVIMLTTYDHEAYVIPSLQAGARGYLLKDVARGTLTDAIRRVAAGESLLDQGVEPPAGDGVIGQDRDRTAPPAALPVHTDLTRRELEVLACVAQALPNRAIAARLFVSENTIKTHVRHIMEKLGASDRAAAVLRAWRLGLLRPAADRGGAGKSP